MILLERERITLDVVAGQGGPFAAKVFDLVDVAVHVAATVIVEHDISHRGVVRRRLDMRHPAVRGHALGAILDAGPGLTAVLSHMDSAIVGADPNHPLLYRTRRNGDDRGVVLGRRDVRGQAARFLVDLPVGIVGRQIIRDRGPGVAAVSRFVNELAAVINGRHVEWILGESGIPVEPQLNSGGGRGRADHFALGVFQVPAEQETALTHGVAAGRVLGIREGVKAIAEADFLPVDAANAARIPDLGGAAPGAVVLEAAVDIVGQIIVDIDVIKLRDWQILNKAEGRALIARNADTAVVAEDQMIGIGRIDPHRVIVDMQGVAGGATRDCGQPLKFLAAVDRARDKGENIVERVRVLGIDLNLRVVEGAIGDIEMGVDRPPGGATIVGAQHGALFGLNQGVYRLGLTFRNADYHAA